MLLRRVPAWLLVFALLAVQTLGLVHRVAHGPRQDLARHGVQAEPVHAHVHAHGMLDGLFTGHGSDGDCRLYDQLSQGDPLGAVAAVPLPLLLPATLFAYFQGEALARRAALFEARAPPALR